MSDDSDDRTASLMTPAKLAQLKVRPKPAASPAAWLDQLASDAGSGHVRRLLDLRKALESQLRERDEKPVAAALGALAQALPKLDYSALEPKGWLARATGKGKEQAAAFVAQADRIGRAGEDVADEIRVLQKKQQAQASAGERTLVEVDVELRAIEKIMDQGARWLQDMRNQLKAREAQGGDAAVQRQIQEDSARCELLVVRLKKLRAASSATQQATERCRALAKSRVSLLESLQRMVDGEWKAWQKKLAPLTEEATATGSAMRGVEEARRLQQDLQRAVDQAGQDCGALSAQEQALASELDAWHAPLQAAA